MISLFILGAIIGSGAFMIIDLNAENTILKDKLKEKEKNNEIVRT